jgi:HSP20 family protein
VETVPSIQLFRRSRLVFVCLSVSSSHNITINVNDDKNPHHSHQTSQSINQSIMSLSSWFHREPVFDGNKADNSNSILAHPYNRVRDPFTEAFSDLMTSMQRFESDLGALRGNGNKYLLANFPVYEIDESNHKYKIKVDLPGVKPEDVNIELDSENGKLVHISGGRKFEKDGIVTESRFEKAFSLRESVDADHLTAHLEHGVLVLEAPMLEEVKPKTRTIAIMSSENDKEQLLEGTPSSVDASSSVAEELR